MAAMSSYAVDACRVRVKYNSIVMSFAYFAVFRSFRQCLLFLLLFFFHVFRIRLFENEVLPKISGLVLHQITVNAQQTSRPSSSSCRPASPLVTSLTPAQLKACFQSYVSSLPPSTSRFSVVVRSGSLLEIPVEEDKEEDETRNCNTTDSGEVGNMIHANRQMKSNNNEVCRRVLVGVQIRGKDSSSANSVEVFAISRDAPSPEVKPNAPC